MRKMHIDSVVSTVQLFKKAVMTEEGAVVSRSNS